MLTNILPNTGPHSKVYLTKLIKIDFVLNYLISNLLMTEANNLSETKAMEIIKDENKNNDNVNKLNKSDDESSDSDHYYDKLANPKKVTSKKDLQINKLEKKLEKCLTNIIKLNNKIIDLESNFNYLEADNNQYKKNNDKLNSTNDFVTRSINFINYKFSTENIQLDTSNIGSINNYKEKVLGKAIEMSEFKLVYDSIINNDNVSPEIKNYFLPLIDEKFSKLKKEYLNEQEKKHNSFLLVFISIFFLLITMFFPQIYKNIY